MLLIVILGNGVQMRAKIKHLLAFRKANKVLPYFGLYVYQQMNTRYLHVDIPFQSRLFMISIILGNFTHKWF